jgi:hypothetical protein
MGKSYIFPSHLRKNEMVAIWYIWEVSFYPEMG